MLARSSTLEPAYQWGATALFLAGAAILGALGFEHIGGYDPCPLCLQQRYAYYGGIPLLFVALVQLSGGFTRWAVAVFLFVALLFLANAGLGVYHAGVEWKFWPGPQTCATGRFESVGGADFLKSLTEKPLIRCDVAPFRFMGLSFAGWNVVASLMVFASSLKAAALTSQRT
jgi:disulfide bond formation protein DsbB